MQLLRHWMHKFQEKSYIFAFLTYASRAQVNISLKKKWKHKVLNVEIMRDKVFNGINVDIA